MSDMHLALSAVKQNFVSDKSDFAWGATEIAKLIGRDPRQTHYLLNHGQIACARKVGGRWMASRSALLREFGAT
jgi:hypothetical protein